MEFLLGMAGRGKGRADGGKGAIKLNRGERMRGRKRGGQEKRAERQRRNLDRREEMERETGRPTDT